MALVSANRNWEEVFTSWSAGPSQTENEKCENAERAVRKAIAASSTLSAKTIQVFPQGSYQNNTNARLESDVDICVRLMTEFLVDLPSGVTKSDVGLVDSSYTYADFKNDVGSALSKHFGEACVRGNKAFDIHENTYRIDADVVATLEHRRYERGANGLYHLSGTEFWSDDGKRVINWPEQNYTNGVEKNNRTGRHFKRVVRILKRLRNEMAANGVAIAKTTSSFLIECLVWNVPDEGFDHEHYRDDVRYVLGHVFNSTMNDESCNEWAEVNDLKYMFRGGQPWTRESAHEFVSAAWDYIGFKD